MPRGRVRRPRGRPRPAGAYRRSAGRSWRAIPRRMRVGAPAPAQVRIGRDKVDGLVQLLLAGRAPHRPDAAVTQALTVRLRAPDGGFRSRR